jgi:hypothetical protein
MKAELKAKVMAMIDRLPENATLEDLRCVIYEHQAIEASVADLDAGRVFTSDQIRQHFGLEPQT